MQPKIAIIIIHYNTPQYLKTCLDHIFAQTYKNIDVYFIDNNSPDQTGLNLVKKTYAAHIGAAASHVGASPHTAAQPQAQAMNLIIIPNKENLGYARAANQGIHLATDADYIVITNPDIVYSPTYFEKIIARAEKALHKDHLRLAGITGKILKYDFGPNPGQTEGHPTNLIDSAGLKLHKTLRVTDEGQGHEDSKNSEDSEKFNQEKEVFGISGACPLYYRSALEDASITINGHKEYFDEDFFMYKEDVDLSWRLQLLGYHFLYYPRAIAFHGRGTGIVKRDTLKQIVKNRKSLSRFQRYYSFRNQNLMIFKNLLWSNYIRNFFYIFTHDLLRLLYALFREPFVLRSLWDYVKLAPKMAKKRRIIMARLTPEAKKRAAKRINKFVQ